MAFCQYCGKKLEKRKKCTCEGAVQAAEREEKEQNSLGNKLKKWLIIVGAVAVLALAVFIAFKIAAGSKSYLNPLNDYIAVVNDKNSTYIDYQYAIKPDFVEKAFEEYYQAALSSDLFIDEVGAQQKYLKECYEAFDDEWDKWKLSFKTEGKFEFDEDEIEECQDDYDDYFEDYIEEDIDSLKAALKDKDGLADYAELWNVSETMAKDLIKAQIAYLEEFKKVKITAGYELNGEFVLKTDEDEYATHSVKIAVVKANGDWCYWGPLDEDLVEFEMDDVDATFLEDFLNSNALFDAGL